MNVLCTSVTYVRKSSNRFVELDETVTNNLLTNGVSQTRDVIDDLTHRIRLSVKTALTDSIEQDVQR